MDFVKKDLFLKNNIIYEIENPFFYIKKVGYLLISTVK